MQVKWYEKAQQHWDEQLEYCAETFGLQTALNSIKTVEEKIESICKFPDAGTLEPLLREETLSYRYVNIQKHIKLIYRYDVQQQIIFIVDVWNTRMSPEHLIDRMK